MPDPEGKDKADSTTTGSSLHAYAEGRKEAVSGDADKLESNDPKAMQGDELEGEDESPLPHEKK
ncbi:MAG: hypothetical protein ACR2LV_01590 [Solirubrobacteraceae bacterium]